MSYDFYIFSQQPPCVMRDQLVVALAKFGFESEVYEEIRTPKLIEGELVGYCTILGWRKESLERAALMSALRSTDHTLRDKLFEDEVLAYTNVYVCSAYEFLANYEVDYFVRDENQANSEMITAAKSAKQVYEVSTSAGRSTFSLLFQSALCKTIADLSEGIIEDPQAGTFFGPAEAEDYLGGDLQA